MFTAFDYFANGVTGRLEVLLDLRLCIMEPSNKKCEPSNCRNHPVVVSEISGLWKSHISCPGFHIPFTVRLYLLGLDVRNSWSKVIGNRGASVGKAPFDPYRFHWLENLNMTRTRYRVCTSLSARTHNFKAVETRLEQTQNSAVNARNVKQYLMNRK